MLGALGPSYTKPLPNGHDELHIISSKVATLFKEADSIGLYRMDSNKLTIVPKSLVKKI